MEISPDIRIPICIEHGSVFNFLHQVDSPKKQSKNRYFVVMNQDPKTDKILLLVTPTTQIEKRRKYIRDVGIDEETIVELAAKEYGGFSRDCVFDCNYLIEVSMSDLIKKIKESGSDHYQKMPGDIMKKLMNGVKKSPLVSDEQKRMIGCLPCPRCSRVL